jgi:DNA-binding NtrC family response regulator
MYSERMSMSKNLSDADRGFFQLVAKAVACNPFEDRYLDLLTQIAGDPKASGAEQDKLVAERVKECVQKLEADNAASVKQYADADREVLHDALLFDVFHRFYPAFDQLIADQIAADDKLVPVPFAEEVLRLLARRGFNAEEARRYFAIIYQIRRAYFFIDRGLVGRSDCMKELRRRLWNNVFTHDIRLYERHLWNRMEDFSTLLLGETGTGKGTAAAAIGRSGFIPFDEKKGCFVESFTRSFVALNLSQFPEALIESELFGHKKGAFTGAVEVHEGVFARCSAHGAIFLDEIGEVSVPVQIKLLQVLQERTFSPVGSHERLRFRGRVIAATNRPLEKLRSGGQIRDDFFYRLCSDVLTVPPLRQRIQEDPRELDDLIVLIVTRLTGESSEEMVRAVRKSIDSSLGNNYAWPGNVRELEQAVRRILLTRHYEGDRKAIAPDLRARLQAGIEDGLLDADALLAGYCALLHERHGTYEEVARRTNLDRRTVKAYIDKHKPS